ncbi:MAG: hypothetical protein EBT03_08300 [Betaproteobacteria bacterium]|nr:hypothetical protein [Betaproteobacteria bacterium]
MASAPVRFVEKEIAGRTRVELAKAGAIGTGEGIKDIPVIGTLTGALRVNKTVDQMAKQGSSTDEILAYMEKNQIGGFSEDGLQNFVGGLVLDPINLIGGEVVKPFIYAKKAGKIAKLAEAGVKIGAEDAAFLAKHDFAGGLYNATFGKASGKLAQIGSAVRGPLIAAIQKEHGIDRLRAIEGRLGADGSETFVRNYQNGTANIARATTRDLISSLTQGNADAAVTFAVTRTIESIDEIGRVDDAIIDNVAAILGITKNDARSFTAKVAELRVSGDLDKLAAFQDSYIKKIVDTEIAGKARYLRSDKQIEAFGGASRKEIESGARGRINREMLELDRFATSEDLWKHTYTKWMAQGAGVTEAKAADLADAAWKAAKGDRSALMRELDITRQAAFGSLASKTAKLRKRLKGDLGRLTVISKRSLTTSVVKGIERDFEILTGLGPESLTGGKNIYAVTLTLNQPKIRKEFVEGVRSRFGDEFADQVQKEFDDAAAILGRLDLDKPKTTTFRGEVIEYAEGPTRKELVAAGRERAAAIREIYLTAYAKVIVRNFDEADALFGRGNLKNLRWEEVRRFVKQARRDNILVSDYLPKNIPANVQKLIDEAQQAGYTLGLAPESGVGKQLIPITMADGRTKLAPVSTIFSDAVDGFGDEILGVTTGSAGSGKLAKLNRLQSIADTWLNPFSNRAVQQNAIERMFTLSGGRLTRREAMRIYIALIDKALEAETSIRGLGRDQIDAVFKDVLGAKNLQDAGFKFADSDPQRLVMIALEGDLKNVGVTQKISGKVKTFVPDVTLITDRYYGNVKFRYNPYFNLAQERIEPFFFNYLRGIRPTVKEILTGKAGATQKTIIENAEFTQAMLGSANSVTREAVDQSLLLSRADAAMARTLDKEAPQLGNAVSRALGVEGRVKTAQIKREQAAVLADRLSVEALERVFTSDNPQLMKALYEVYNTSDPKIAIERYLADKMDGLIPTRAAERAKGLYPLGFGLPYAIDPKLAKISKQALIRRKYLRANDIPSLEAAVALAKDAGLKGDDLARLEKHVEDIRGMISRSRTGKISTPAKFIRDVNKIEGFAVRQQETMRFLRPLLEHPRIKQVIGEFTDGVTEEKALTERLIEALSVDEFVPGIQEIGERVARGEKLLPSDVDKIARGLQNTMAERSAQELVYSAVTLAYQNAQKQAFKIGYYSQEKSLLERSLNHPYLGLYPTSYMWGKIIPEFSRALFKYQPFTGKPRPLGGAAWAGWISDQVSMALENSEFGKFLQDRPEAYFLITNLIPATPDQIGVSMPAWFRKSVLQPLARGKFDPRTDILGIGTEFIGGASNIGVLNVGRQIIGTGQAVSRGLFGSNQRGNETSGLVPDIYNELSRPGQ